MEQRSQTYYTFETFILNQNFGLLINSCKYKLKVQKKNLKLQNNKYPINRSWKAFLKDFLNVSCRNVLQKILSIFIGLNIGVEKSLE